MLKMTGACPSWGGVIGRFDGCYNGNSIGSVIRRLCLEACVYLVWQERNKRLYRDEKRNVDELFKIFCDIVKMRLASLKMRKSNVVSETERVWEVKLNMFSEIGNGLI